MSFYSLDRGNGMLSNVPNADLYPMNHSNMNMNMNINMNLSDDYLNHDGNNFIGNKCMPIKALDNTDYMIVSSEEIIDILDLTNDEVEQILDDNMISTQDFDALNSPRLSQTTSQPYNRLPRINLATNLTKVASSPSENIGEYGGKSIDMRPLETPTINLDSMTATNNSDTDAETIDTIKLITMPVSVTRKKSGRTKGARQISMSFFVCVRVL